MDEKIKTVWVIQAYQNEVENGQLLDVVTLELFAGSEIEAMKKAKRLVKKKFYRLASVIEKYDT